MIANTLLSLMFMVFAQDAVTFEGSVTDPATPLYINEQKIDIQDDLSFTASFPLAEPGYLNFRQGRIAQPLFVQPGHRVAMRIGVQGVEFDGDARAENTYLQAYTAFRHAQAYEFFAMPGDAFMTKLASVEETYRSRIENLKNKVHPEFYRREQARIRWWWADVRLHYRDFDLHFPKANADTPSNLALWLKHIDFDNPDMLEFEESGDFLHALIERKAKRAIQLGQAKSFGEFVDTKLRISIMNNHFRNPKVRAHLLYKIIDDHIDNFGIAGVDPFMQMYRKIGENENTERLEDFYQREKARRDGRDIRIYKKVDGFELEAVVVTPDRTKFPGLRPAVAVFHGGGWTVGAAEWGARNADTFAEMGLVGVSFQYRIRGRHGTTPLAALRDARSAIRWMRQNAASLQIDPERILANGWSAGGHLAISAAMFDGFDEAGEDATVSGEPNALSLWVPAVDLTRDRWFAEILGNAANPADLSPLDHVRPGLPPTLIAQGTADRTVPYPGVKAFVDRMRAEGNLCEMQIFEDRPHLFFGSGADRDAIFERTKTFLAALGYVKE